MKGHFEIETILFVLLIPAIGIMASLAVSTLITEGD
jgi:hypothetical protein